MREKPQINLGVLKEKELLEKLSLEISSDFSISEKLAKKLIYKTHLSLSELRDEIVVEQKENNINQQNDNLKEEYLNKLLLVLDGVRKVIEQASKSEIEELKQVLEKNTFLVSDESKLIKKIFSKQLIEKAKNPTNISEQIMGASLGIANSAIVITEILYYVGKGIITSIPDFIAIINGKAEFESLKKV